MVASCPFSRKGRPITCGSEFKKVRQKRSLTTTTGGRPGFSVRAEKKRPAAGVTPSVEKYSGETSCP